MIKIYVNFMLVLKTEYQFWERNAYSFEIYKTQVFEQKLNYIHMNPCSKKWSLAICPEEYIYSSAAFYIIDDKRWNFLKNYREDFY